MTQGDVFHDRVIHRVLERKVEQYGNREFFRFDDRTFGYEDFNREANRVASGLQRLGVSKGDKVAIMMRNRPSSYSCGSGCASSARSKSPLT